MTKKEFQVKYSFTDDDMARIELALSISEGRITAIYDQPLKYQDIKIKFDKII